MMSSSDAMGITEQDRSALADEKIIDAVVAECRGQFFGLRWREFTSRHQT
jgi:hypothetical protein